MKQSLDFLVQTLLDIELRDKEETMEEHEATILYAEHADEFVASATLADIITRGQYREADLKGAFD
jgi:hypothetical protein